MFSKEQIVNNLNSIHVQSDISMEDLAHNIMNEINCARTELFNAIIDGVDSFSSKENYPKEELKNWLRFIFTRECGDI